VSIEVTPASASIVIGTTTQFLARGTYTDGSSIDLTNSVTWASSDTTIATMSTVHGFEGVAIATWFSSGHTNITATFSGKVSNTAVLTVTF